MHYLQQPTATCLFLPLRRRRRSRRRRRLQACRFPKVADEHVVRRQQPKVVRPRLGARLRGPGRALRRRDAGRDRVQGAVRGTGGLRVGLARVLQQAGLDGGEEGFGQQHVGQVGDDVLRVGVTVQLRAEQQAECGAVGSVAVDGQLRVEVDVVHQQRAVRQRMLVLVGGGSSRRGGSRRFAVAGGASCGGGGCGGGGGGGGGGRLLCCSLSTHGGLEKREADVEARLVEGVDGTLKGVGENAVELCGSVCAKRGGGKVRA